VYDSITRIVASVSTRVFVGEELAENEEWLTATIDYTVQLVTCATILKHIPALLLPVLYRFVPAYRRLSVINDTATRLIKPIIQTRREAIERPVVRSGDNMLQWMLNERVKKSFHDKDYTKLAQFQLQLAFAAIHTTSMVLINAIYDLVAWPENIAILREEVESELANNSGSFEGRFVKTLQKMDSFIKESQRHNPVGYSESSIARD
jgi:cytochrome P450